MYFIYVCVVVTVCSGTVNRLELVCLCLTTPRGAFHLIVMSLLTFEVEQDRESFSPWVSSTL